MGLLKANALVKQFPGRETSVLSGVGFEIGKGEVVALTGSSGSGKTSLLRILAGLEEPDAGIVLFRNKKVQGPAEKLVAGHDSIRLVHQHFELAHRRTVYENISQKLRHLHPDEQEEQTVALIKICRLENVASEYVEELSGGEKQRLALARTLAEEPELLLLDEPFSNLDPHLKEEIRYDLFNFIREKKLSVIMVSHDPKDALSLADRILVLEQGRMVQEGTPEEVYYNPVSQAVAALFGKINICRPELLLAYGKGGLIEYLNDIPHGALLGIRPEFFRVVAAEETHLNAKIVQLYFQGSQSEAKVALGEDNHIFVQLPPLFKRPKDQRVSLKLNYELIQVWSLKELESFI